MGLTSEMEWKYFSTYWIVDLGFQRRLLKGVNNDYFKIEFVISSYQRRSCYIFHIKSELHSSKILHIVKCEMRRSQIVRSLYQKIETLLRS